MGRVYNFSAGPAVLPESVLREAAEEMLDYRGCGMSVMEMSHRSSAFKAIIEEAEADLRDLMGIPDNYKVLFLQGGGSTQFAMVPLNLMRGGFSEYIVSGSWSKKAYQEAKRFGDARILGDSSDDNFRHHAIVEYKGKWYLFHHDCVPSNGKTWLRSLKVCELEYDANGRIITIEGQ